MKTFNNPARLLALSYVLNQNHKNKLQIIIKNKAKLAQVKTVTITGSSIFKTITRKNIHIQFKIKAYLKLLLNNKPLDRFHKIKSSVDKLKLA